MMRRLGYWLAGLLLAAVAITAGLVRIPAAPAAGPTAGLGPIPAGPAAPCVTTDLHGHCPASNAYSDRHIAWSNGYTTTAGTDGWACGADGSGCGPARFAAWSAHHWTVTTSQPRGNTGVLMYPNTSQITYTHAGGKVPVSSLSLLQATYAESMPPASSGTIAEFAFDIWTSREVMVWLDNQGRGTGGAKIDAHATFAGQKFTLMNYGSEIIWSADRNHATGTVDLLAMLRWLQSHRWLPANAALGQIDLGFEICSTGGQAQSFTMSGYTLTKRP